MYYLKLVNDEKVKAFIPLFQKYRIGPQYSKTINMAWYYAFKENLSDEATKHFVINALKYVLSNYAQTEPATKSGGFLRKLASFNWFLNILKYIRLGKK